VEQENYRSFLYTLVIESDRLLSQWQRVFDFPLMITPRLQPCHIALGLIRAKERA